MADVTQILSRMESGDPTASDELLPVVYDELRKLAQMRLAREKPGQTLQATALVHDAYLRLVGGSQPSSWDGRGHFFAAAAEAMRRILINRARDKQRLKCGGGWQKVDLDKVEIALTTPDDILLDLDDAIDKLADEDSVAAELVKLRFFAGLTQSEAACTLEIPRRTADRHWAFARAWLYDRLQSSNDR